MKKKLERFLLSWDTFFALVAIIVAYVIVPETVKNSFCYTIYNTGITVLSIIFSIFFASLTVIMAFPDNEFIVFIEKDHGLFTMLLRYFRATLFALFLGLLFTICIYMFSLYYGEVVGDKKLFVIFCGVFTYCLVATMIAVDVTLKIISSRAEYLANRKHSGNGDNENEPNEQET